MTSKAENKKQRFTREQQKKITATLLIAPAILFIIVLIAYPLITVISDSFQYVNLVNTSVSGFAGLDNFKEVITNEHFLKSLYNTSIWTVLSVAGEYLFGLIAALALNRYVKGISIFRSLLILPFVVPIVVAGLTWEWMLDPDFGIINYLLVKVGIIDSSINWLGGKETALLTVTFVNIWRTFPFYAVTLLSALKAIPLDTIEAAAIDGASMKDRFFKIIMPQLKSASMILIGMHLIWTAINFDFIWIMTEGGPNYASETLPIQIYRYAMKQYDIGAASALSTMMIATMTIALVTFYYIKSNRNKEMRR